MRGQEEVVRCWKSVHPSLASLAKAGRLGRSALGTKFLAPGVIHTPLRSHLVPSLARFCADGPLPDLGSKTMVEAPCSDSQAYS